MPIQEIINRAERDWKEFSKTIEADFVSDGYIAHDQIKSFLQQQIIKAANDLIDSVINKIEGEIDFYERLKKDSLQKDLTMLAYDMDSRYVALRLFYSKIKALRYNKLQPPIKNN